ncbi:hypothetical protein Pla110_08800 [Polystyrenella longa]|uniref:PSP1 C-terminal domain-containing protein n=1 Tax=Polystyrenella longa TaxID=2528007 RepID=A0A518CIW6_9PLAN|nr:PSP1 C-terminal domain-containing protein [Polystyrenella longa]QDU79175.1 hypothetical protein Pla110_08800 [Polystyrenella longa]
MSTASTEVALQVLIRYGTISQVERCTVMTAEAIPRGANVVVQTERGEELAELLQSVPEGQQASEDEAAGTLLLRIATEEEVTQARKLTEKCEEEFPLWQKRIEDWKLQLELIDLERTLDDSLLILYVLNDRGPDCTKLALRVSAEGLGNVKVQPVDADGPVAVTAAVGTGTCSSGGSCGCR